MHSGRMIEESVTTGHAAVTPSPRSLGPDCFMTRTGLEIVRVEVTPLFIELNEPFGIASGAQQRADNVLVQVELSDGTVGLGEAAPFPAVNGETQSQVAEALEGFRPSWVGTPAGRWRERCGEAAEELRATPSGVCALQSALLDAWLRSYGVSMWKFFGATRSWLETDITVPTGSVGHAATAARRARESGFRTLKIKVGARAHDADVLRLREIARVAPECSLVLDANAGFSATEALELLRALGPIKDRVTLFEQPTPREDLDAMRQVLVDGRVAVAADESVKNVHDVLTIAKKRAASAINVKSTKSGLVAAVDMTGLAKALGLDLMIGGMVESRLCMCVSACVAGGLGGFQWVDLDTPLFMRDSPLVGGYEQVGSRLDLEAVETGHGVRLDQ